MKILIVDDSKTILKTMKMKLEGELGIEVLTALSMKECADLILKYKGKIDLALLDYNLPDASDGQIVKFCDKFKIPSILLTASELHKNNEIFQNRYLIDYIIKNSSYALDYAVSIVRRFIMNDKIEVMIVDDSKTFAAKMENLCRKYNLHTITHTNPKEALENIKKRAKLKLILVDYMMPEINGLEFTTEVRKQYKKDELSIIALSGTSEKEIVASFLKFGANDFLYKDFSNEEFIARVNNNLEVIELFSTTQDKAKRDYLTGVFNKKYFLQVGNDIYENSKKKKNSLAVACIEFDKFNTFRESYGHDAADKALQYLANTLEQYFNVDSIISRFSSDQFCLVVQHRLYGEFHQDLQELQELIQNNPLKIENETYNLTISVGASVEYNENFEQMLYVADEALCNIQNKQPSSIAIE